jgi:predicted regulator of Ras-like GTPase activity (Roadblock/LC7/MglB family)
MVYTDSVVFPTLASLIERLLVASGAMGVGVIDENGWLVESAGSHGGLDAEALASHVVALAHTAQRSLAAVMEEGSDELVVVTERYRLFIRRVERYVVYLVTSAQESEARARAALDEAVLAFGEVVRLERPLEPSSGI